MLGCNKNYAILAFNYVLKNSKEIILALGMKKMKLERILKEIYK